MKTHIALMGLLTAAALTHGAAVPQSPETPSDPRTALPRIAQALLDAVATGDRAIWDRHLADDGVFTDERGVRRTKEELLDALQPLPAGYEGRLEARDVTVHAFGTTAVVTFRAEEHLKLFGQTVADTYFQTDTYLWRGGRWQVAASHVQAQIGDPPAVAVPAATLARYAGTYQLAPDTRLGVRVDEKRLILEREGRPPQTLLAETACTFFTPDGWDARWIFVGDDGGGGMRLLARRRGADLVWTRVTDR